MSGKEISTSTLWPCFHLCLQWLATYGLQGLLISLYQRLARETSLGFMFLCVLRVLANAVLTRVLCTVVANINLSFCWFYDCYFKQFFELRRFTRAVPMML